jgi:hypothetical protein
MSKARPRSKKSPRPSTAQIIFLVLTIIIVLSFVLSLVIKV